MRLKHAFRIASAFLAIAVPLAACGGGGDDGATVEASLQHYFSTFNPEDSIFPYGDGPPRVKDKSCKDQNRYFLPVAPDSTQVITNREKRLALWECFVRFTHFTLRVQAALNESSEVVWAQPAYGDDRKPPKLSPARTYTGGG